MILALISGAGAIYFFFSGIREENPLYDKIGSVMLMAQTAFMTLASVVLMFALVTSYFKIEYVAQYTDLRLPMIYKLSAFWAGQAGSLLFWGLLAALFGFIELFRIKGYGVRYRSSVFLTVALTTTFFLILTTFVTNPFAELDFMPRDGMGMNPLLQNPGMIYHPPTLYVGFVGFTIILGHSLGALLTRDASPNWVKSTRGWSMITWIFLTIGIVLGGQWAYVELGWGGYWAWDPVENASLFPWLTATAFLHSAYMFQNRGKLKTWTHMMIMTSYVLCIFGTFLTRSGIMDSVHSFGKSNLGSFFIVYMLFIIIGYLAVYFTHKEAVEESGDEKDFNFTSREGLFFIANWLFTGLTFVIVIGTIMPIISEMVYDVLSIIPSVKENFVAKKLTVGIPYYNKVSSPFFMLILVLAGIAPLVSYGKSAGKEFFKWLTPAAVLAVIVPVLMAMNGYTGVLPLVLACFTTLSLGSILTRVFMSMKQNGPGVVLKQRRHYGGLLVHFGVVIMAYGIIASSFYNAKTEAVVAPGESFDFGKYEMQVGDLRFSERRNFTAVFAPVKVVNKETGKKVVTLAPQRRYYVNNEEAWAEVAIHSKLKGDLYLILASYSKPDNYIGIQAVFQPLIVWIWIGCAIMCLGGAYAISDRRKDG
ncbi:heme lyase CcmF/NrfE family subunit [Limisalsivibrio acetivorans]|uniref:heme lyase CcmF/NrfE family subunit n=1 Tax=Limisalsivibrio acetivorans TaxID=1304888 RepID=UPI0012DC2FB8|nr:cytochrome c-type biogenesis CcmF C-terminal domain-containing protein [Limisalsivibrio acetivorans]